MEGSGCGLFLRHCPGICLKGPGNNTKGLSLDSRSPGRDLNPGPPEQDAGVLSTRP
jgi:hypothetical protein